MRGRGAATTSMTLNMSSSLVFSIFKYNSKFSTESSQVSAEKKLPLNNTDLFQRGTKWDQFSYFVLCTVSECDYQRHSAIWMLISDGIFKISYKCLLWKSSGSNTRRQTKSSHLQSISHLHHFPHTRCTTSLTHICPKELKTALNYPSF